MRRRVEYLHHLAQVLVGRRATVDDLVDLVNRSWRGTTTVITNETWIKMGALILQEGWPKVNPSLTTLNPPTSLIHWRPMVYLFNQLTREEQRQLVAMGSL